MLVQAASTDALIEIIKEKKIYLELYCLRVQHRSLKSPT